MGTRKTTNKSNNFFLVMMIAILIVYAGVTDIYAGCPPSSVTATTNENCCDKLPVQQLQYANYVDGCCYSCTPEVIAAGYCKCECCSSVAGTDCTLNECESCGGDTPPCEDDDECPLSCPAPLSDSGLPTFLLNDFASCEDDCDNPFYMDCFEVPSNPPVSSLVIVPEHNQTAYGFTSDTHTGVVNAEIDMNTNEPIKMIATYTDTTAAEIEALYIWFSHSSQAMASTPRIIDFFESGETIPDQAPKTVSTSQFGFLIHREGSTWRPYIPSILGSSTGDKWVWANYADSIFPIIGPDGRVLARVHIESIVTTGPSVVMTFNVYFNGLTSKVTEGTYNLYVMANDIFGFTPYDNYDAYPAIADKIGDYFDYGPGVIRYYKDWSGSGKDWSVDLTNPQAFNLQAVPYERNKIKFSWELSDNLGIYGTVGNMFIEVTNIADLANVDILDAIETSPVTPNVVDPFTLGLETDYTSVLGSLNGPYLFKNINPTTSGSVIVDINNNNEWILKFYITVFDNGGNVANESISFDLRDWIVTQGGIVYSTYGYDITTRMFTEAQDSLWSAKDLINRFRPTYADISSELLAELLDVPPSSPAKADKNMSYLIRPFPQLDYDNYFATLYSLVNERRDTYFDPCYINVFFDGADAGWLEGKLSGNYNPGCGTEPIYFYSSGGTLVVGSQYNPFVCDGKAVVIAWGGNPASSIIINYSVLNSNPDQDACIFIAQGNVYIKGGTAESTSDTLEYDEINAYIFAGGKIYIEEDVARDGLYVNGGLYSRGGIEIERSLLLADRFYYPAVAVDHHSKYGTLGGLLFGSEVNMQKVEVGLKPY